MPGCSRSVSTYTTPPEHLQFGCGSTSWTGVRPLIAQAGKSPAAAPVRQEIDQSVVIGQPAIIVPGQGIDDVEQAQDLDLDPGLLGDLADRRLTYRLTESLAPTGQRPGAGLRRLGPADQQHPVTLEDDHADPD